MSWQFTHAAGGDRIDAGGEAPPMEDVMSKGRDRPGKEKRKPKADKNKKQKGPPLAAAAGQTQLHIGQTQPPAKKA